MPDSEEKPAERSTYVCPAEHSGWLVSPLRALVNHPDRILKGLVNEGDTAVDLGCGPGFFTLPLARMVGETGHVVAVDIQEGMLARLSARAVEAGLASRIELHHVGADGLGMTGPADFALAFWMVHEVPNEERLLRETYGFLGQGGRFLLVEPMGHVSKAQFGRTVATAKEAGFTALSRRRVGFSRAMLFERP